jgi:hypothetical protein
VVAPPRLDPPDEGAERLPAVGQGTVLLTGDGDVGVAFGVGASAEAVVAVAAVRGFPVDLGHSGLLTVAGRTAAKTPRA